MQFKIPPKSQLVDKQFVRIAGPDGLNIGYVYDANTCTLYGKESEIIIPALHGLSHITDDPIPTATTDLNGLMSSSDKAKLDAITQTRLGVLGFSGAGFPDDGGFMQGDIILAAGSEFISLERIGNVVRFTVDSPLPINCGCEECAQIFWIQDESDISAIRPPSCAGKIPDVNIYGELKVYQLPESTLVNPSDPTPILNTKGNYPALIFKRYDDGITPGQAEYELVLSRNSNRTTNVGWAMTPGAVGVPQSVWFMGLDDDGNQIKFEFDVSKEPELLGALLYKGHSLTRRMAVIVGYTPTVLSTNIYNCKFWSVSTATAIGDEFTATNVWQYNNPENSATDVVAPKQLVLDATHDLLPIGSLVQIWEFELSRINGVRQVKRFFSQRPRLNPTTLWGLGGVIRFGDVLEAREELPGIGATELTSHASTIDDIRLIERSQWGITGFEDRLLLSDDGLLLEGTDQGKVVRSDEVLFVVVSDDTDNPTPNFKITAKAAYEGSTFILNEFTGRQLVFTSGNLVGIQFDIIENSASTITLYDPDGRGAEVQVGDTFDIHIVSETLEPSGVAINSQYVAEIDPNVPGLVVKETLPDSDQERPVFLWHRNNHKNVYLKALIGRPSNSKFPPIDILLKAPIDSTDDQYFKVLRRGTIDTGPFKGNEFIVVKGAGVGWKQLPSSGVVRILTGKWRGVSWAYQYKCAFDRFDDSAVMLIGFSDRFPFDSDDVPELEGTGATGVTNLTEFVPKLTPDSTTVVQLIHDDYTTPALRLEFSVNDTSESESIQLQFVGGLLDMSVPYELNIDKDFSDDFVRGFKPGTRVLSKIYTQNGLIPTGIETPDSDPDMFRVYEGGFIPFPVNGSNELWNMLEVMYRDNQLWVWWNGLLIPPDAGLTASQSTPVNVTTPYFPVQQQLEVGKVGLRLWPGAVIREFEVRDQLVGFNEFSRGQLELST